MGIESIGEFELDREKLIGKGAWGEVYLGRQKSLNRTVAIKILKKELTSDEDFVKRFRREAETLAKLIDEHIIQVYSAGENDGSYYFIMEYVQGQPLSKMVENGRKFKVNEIVYVGESVAKALKAAWESPAKIVHRDIKPSNIMVSYTSSLIAPIIQQKNVSESVAFRDVNIMESKVKVMDFGLAKISEGDKEATMVGTVIGTPKYISPEQGMGNPADIRSDIYSLGIVLYEMATGRIPFDGETAMSMIRHHIYDTATTPSQFNPEVPAGLEAIIMKCIHKDPNKRYSNPQELLEDLLAFKNQRELVHTSTSKAALEATMVSDIIRKEKKTKWFIYPAIAGGVIICGVATYMLFFNKASQPVNPAGVTNTTTTNQTQVQPITTTANIPSNPIVTPPEPAIDKELVDLLTTIKGLIDDDKLEDAWEELDKVPEKSRDLKEVKTLKELLGEKWNKKTRTQLAEKLQADIQEKLPERFTEKSYTTKEQKEFNYLLRLLESKKFTAVYSSLDNIFINIRDEEISPPAMYFKMKLVLLEKPENYLDKLVEQLSELEARYAANSVVPLAKTLFDAAKMAYQDEIYKGCLAAISSKLLEEQLKLMEGFKKKYEGNNYLGEVLVKIEADIARIKKEIYEMRITKYQNLLGIIRNLMKTKEGYLTAASKLPEARKLAEDLSQDTKTLDDLQSEIENGYLTLCGIKVLSQERINQFHRFIQTIQDDAEMILIPNGDFIMGANNSEPNESPEHKVIISDYYIDKYEITNTQFEKFVTATGYKTDAEKTGKGWVWIDGELKEVSGANWRNPEGDGIGIKDRMHCPVVQISWSDAKSYAEWVDKRLPTEAEWEKAARGTDGRIYPWGNDWIASATNNIVTGPCSACPVADNEAGKSPYGCYHMSGNVAEWCADWFDEIYYHQSNIGDNPKGPKEGKSHALRGGSWVLAKKGLFTTARQPGHFDNQTNFWSNYIGFRCVKDVDKELLKYIKYQ